MRWNLLAPELSVGDIFVSLDLYVKGVGFRIFFFRENPLSACPELNGAQPILKEDHSEAWFAGRVCAPREREAGLQIEVFDVGAACSRLAVLGVRPFQDLRQIWYETDTQGVGLEGQKEFVVQDPDGYLIRLVEML